MACGRVESGLSFPRGVLTHSDERQRRPALSRSIAANGRLLR